MRTKCTWNLATCTQNISSKTDLGPCETDASDPTTAPRACGMGEAGSSLSGLSRTAGSPEDRNVPESEAELLGDCHTGVDSRLPTSEVFGFGGFQFFFF